VIDLLKTLCKHGLPSGNVFEYAAIQVQKYETKMKSAETKAKTIAEMKENAIKHQKKVEPEVHYSEESKRVLTLSYEPFQRAFP
jgi:hypothetical protein